MSVYRENAKPPPCAHRVELQPLVGGGNGPDDALDLAWCILCGAEGWRFVDGCIVLRSAAQQASKGGE